MIASRVEDEHYIKLEDLVNELETMSRKWINDTLVIVRLPSDLA